MKRLLVAALLLVSCIATTGATTPKVNEVGRAFHATVELQTEDGQTFCSGVIVDDVVLTAYHCAAATAPIYVKDVWTTWKSQVDNFDYENDLAVLRPVDDHPLPDGVRLARKAPNFADDVYLIGHALGTFDFSITRGIVSHPRREDGLFGGLWIQHDAGQIGGNSGGPLLNSRGRLVGIASFTRLSQLHCRVDCSGMYTTSHIHGAVHLDPIREILD